MELKLRRQMFPQGENVRSVWHFGPRCRVISTRCYENHHGGLLPAQRIPNTMTRPNEELPSIFLLMHTSISRINNISLVLSPIHFESCFPRHFRGAELQWVLRGSLTEQCIRLLADRNALVCLHTSAAVQSCLVFPRAPGGNKKLR